MQLSSVEVPSGNTNVSNGINSKGCNSIRPMLTAYDVIEMLSSNHDVVKWCMGMVVRVDAWLLEQASL